MLIVSAGTSFGMPAATAACRAGAWPDPGLQHLAHDHVLDLLRLELRTGERFADGKRTELGRGVRGEATTEASERRSHGGDDDRAGHWVSVPSGHVQVSDTVSDTWHVLWDTPGADHEGRPRIASGV